MAGKPLTPMMKQYHAIKAKHQDMLLFFRLGDFYEMFEKDAHEASSVLNLTLTSRHGIDMCGLPYHAAGNYISRLLATGRKVAICEQVEDPSKAKGIVKREVTRVITPGTLVDEKFIPSNDHNLLMAVVQDKDKAAIALCDISTGEFLVSAARGSEMNLHTFVEDELARYSPTELILPERLKEGGGTAYPGITLTFIPDWIFDTELSEQALKEHFKLVSLDGFGLLADDNSIAVSHAILYYLKETQKDALRHIHAITRLAGDRFVSLSRATQANLELVKNMSGGTEYTLFSVINRTHTPMGSRLLKQTVLKPLRDPGEINRRLDAVSIFFDDARYHEQFRSLLRRIKDLERLISRVAMARANARDLLGLSVSLEASLEIRKMLLEKEKLLEYRQDMADFTPVIEMIIEAIKEEPAALINDGNIIREGFSAELDDLRAVSGSGKKWIADFQVKERDRTGISSLKVKYNKVVGYYIDVTKPNLPMVPDNYERKQTLVSSERFITSELKEYETKVLSAHEKIISLEEKLFCELRDKVSGYLEPVQLAARVIALLDMFSSFSAIARDCDYVRPFVDESDKLYIEDGRHPVVEVALDDRFVPNNSLMDLEENRILIVTGPNMAGKSTYLRQTALVTLMAQMGSYVPARKAEIGVVDKIFTRVGASDNLARGQSTFLVEMIETAYILNNASDRSLIIMDEIGRGTSTYDGLSIAWAIIEYLLRNKSRGGRTLFATHYHELTVLGEEEGINNLNVEVREWNDEVIFLKKVVPGCADQSYGIHVARLAGLPVGVIERAKLILKELEDKSDDLGHARLKEISTNKNENRQLALFKPFEEDILETIRHMDLNAISPLDALNLLAEFKEKL